MRRVTFFVTLCDRNLQLASKPPPASLSGSNPGSLEQSDGVGWVLPAHASARLSGSSATVGGRWGRSWTVAGLCVALCGPAAGQVTPGQRTATVFVGAWYAGESIPQSLNPVCDDTVGREAGSKLGGSVTAAMGNVAIEVSVGHHWTADAFCSGGRVDRDGVVTNRLPEPRAGDFTKTALRLRVAANEWLAVAIGAGCAWSKDIPYVTSSLGFRRGGSVRYGVEVEAAAYRIPWQIRTSTYEDGAEVQLHAIERYRAWDTGLSLRFVLEVPMAPPAFR